MRVKGASGGWVPRKLGPWERGKEILSPGTGWDGQLAVKVGLEKDSLWHPSLSTLRH